MEMQKAAAALRTGREFRLSEYVPPHGGCRLGHRQCPRRAPHRATVCTFPQLSGKPETTDFQQSDRDCFLFQLWRHKTCSSGAQLVRGHRCLPCQDAAADYSRSTLGPWAVSVTDQPIPVS